MFAFPGNMHPVGHKRFGLGVNLAFSIEFMLDVCVFRQYVKFDPVTEGRSLSPHLFSSRYGFLGGNPAFAAGLGYFID